MDQKVPLFPEIIGGRGVPRGSVPKTTGFRSSPYQKVNLQHQITLYLVRAAQIKGSRGSGPFSGLSGGPGALQNLGKVDAIDDS